MTRMRGTKWQVSLVLGVAWVSGCNFPLPMAGGQSDAAPDAQADAAPDAPVAGPRCQSLGMTCGATSMDSCCTGSLIPTGTFYRSYDVAGDGYSGDQSALATVSTFRLEKYEVTVGRFRAFVNAGHGTQLSAPASGSGAHAAIAGSGWNESWNGNLPVDRAALIAAVKCDAAYQTWTDSPGANEARPMNCITWYEAMAFCIWDEGYLPTEAEWNYAATGGSQQRAYPWSSPAGSLALAASRASYYDGTNCVGDGTPGCAVTDLVPVGSKPMGDGRWGQSDLAGNVREWILDWDGAYVTPCADCARVGTAALRVIRGGGFNSGAPTLRAGTRNNGAPEYRYPGVGFRCARTP